MSSNDRPWPRATLPLVRCAVYTRKSTEEGLEQEFNSLDAQREAAQAYVTSQAGQGWSLLPDRYDGGGFTGGHMDRPALQRLLADIAAGQIDAVIVYKVDRLSRSLLDFARLMESFEGNRVSFVSVTQQFNRASVRVVCASGTAEAVEPTTPGQWPASTPTAWPAEPGQAG